MQKLFHSLQNRTLCTKLRKQDFSALSLNLFILDETEQKKMYKVCWKKQVYVPHSGFCNEQLFQQKENGKIIPQNIVDKCYLNLRHKSLNCDPELQTETLTFITEIIHNKNMYQNLSTTPLCELQLVINNVLFRTYS